MFPVMETGIPFGKGGVVSAKMHASRPLVDTVFAAMLVVWISKEILTRRRDRDSRPAPTSPRRWAHSRKLAVGCCAMATSMYLGFGLHQCWRGLEVTLKYGSFSSALTWLIACSASACTDIMAASEGRKSWPHVLLLWWFYSSASSLFSLSLYLAAKLEPRDQPPPALFLAVQPELADLLALPFSLTLCLSLITISCAHKNRRSYFEQPLLGKQTVECNIREEVYKYDDAGFWSRLLFRWLNPLFRRGKKERLELAHIPDIPLSESAELVSTLLEESIRKHKTAPYLLPQAIGSAVWKSLAANGMCAGINTLASYLGPLMIRNFVDLLSNNDEGDLTYRHGLILASIFFVSKTVESLSQRHWYFGAQQIGVRLRAGLTLLIYKKCLSSRSSDLSNGKTVNLINVDVERVGDFCSYIHGIWLLPVHMFLALVILQRNLGTLPAMAALFSTTAVMVSNTPLAMMQEKFQTRIMEAKDARIKATSEALKSIRILKLHSWEPSFLKKILQLRETERFWLKRYLYTCSAVAFLFWTSPTLVSITTFGACIIMGTPLMAGTVLSALATFRILQEPIYNLPELISMIAQTKVSIDRINEFLREEDQKRLMNCPTQGETDLAIEIEPAEYAWDSSDPTSKKISVSIGEKVKIMKGQKVAVCGLVGSGKSSLMCSMLGEVPRISGATTKVTGTKAYAPQRAWIQTGTIKENILFGRKMDAILYDSVLDACALKQDIESWSDGDLTVVGERGTNLSGGQKQRIQLARSVYSDSDVYFLDDPFSAVDAHTSTYLFKRCLTGLLSSKTVVYATHQLELLEAADLIIVMKDGSMVQHGKYRELAKSIGGELVRQVNAHRQSIDHMKLTAKEDKVAPTGLEKAIRIDAFEEKHPRRSTDDKLPQQMQEEETMTGRVKWSVYSVFVMCAYKGALVPVILLCQVLFQGLQMGSNYWIAWAASKGSLISKEKLIGVFAMLSGGSSFFILGRAVLLSTIAIKTAQHLFLGMISAIFHAPLSFFDSTPSSRILSRSSTDQSIVDTDIPYRVAGLVFALIQLLSVIVLMCEVAWQIFPLFLIILTISVWLQAYYITTARELARMVGTRKAPILHHFSETIAGAPVIRSFSREDLFVQRLYSLVDGYSKVVFCSGSTMEWLCVRVNFLFSSIFFVVLVVLVSLPKSSVNPSLAGLIVTYGLNLNVLQGWVLWNMCNVENKMISVERILQFMEVPSEEAISVVKEAPASPKWPQEGKIELEDLHIRYGPTLPIVLKGITCTLPGKKKIGIVGRTGSGKSTLIQALFRVVEPSSGRILIDGTDIAKLRLHELRSRLSIIPQDPVLFQGTVRMNLDPLEEHSDEEIWEVLNKCNLADTVRRDFRLLNAPVVEDGENWSVGQRQLVCLIRVLLKKRKVLVLDEATASVDSATDNAIWQAIQDETRDCTVLTVAHRIPTVIDNDLVLVLDQGKVVEYDSPKALLENKSSSFSALVGEFLLRSSWND